MSRYIASRITSGNVLFPNKIEIDAVNVTYYKGYLTGYESTVIPRNSIASVSIGTGILFGDIIIETTGGKKIVANGFSKSDAKSIIGILSTNKSIGDINQNVFVNTKTSINASDEYKSENIGIIQEKISSEKEFFLLAEKKGILTLKEIILNINIEMDKAENILKKLVDKGFAKKEIDSSGQIVYIFETEFKSLQALKLKILTICKSFSGNGIHTQEVMDKIPEMQAKKYIIYELLEKLYQEGYIKPTKLLPINDFYLQFFYNWGWIQSNDINLSSNKNLFIHFELSKI